MDGKPPTTARDGQPRRVDPDPVLSFVDTGGLEPQPRLLVERLLFARGLLQANLVLAPKFVLGECAAAHHILLGGAASGVVAAERLLTYGFQVEASREPPGIRFFVASSHGETEIRALLIAITIVVRELSAAPQPRARGTESSTISKRG